MGFLAEINLILPYSLSDILIRTTKIAISDSDIHCFENGVKSGITLGHDAVGVVVDVSFFFFFLDYYRNLF